VKRLFLKAAAVGVAGALLEACGGGGGGGGSGGGGGGGGGGNCQASGTETLLQRLQDGRFSALLQAVNKAGLAGSLDDRSANLTFFAPDNDAFDRLGNRIGLGDRNALVAALSGQQWKDILNFATLPQRSSSCELTPPSGVKDLRPETLFDQPIGKAVLIFVRENGGPLYIWDGIGRYLITFQESDLGAVNGVMHVPSDVLLPRYVLTVSQMLRASVDGYSDFAASIASQVPELNGTEAYTVFASFNGTFTPSSLTANQRRHQVIRGTVKGDDFARTPIVTPLFGRALALTSSTIGGKTITDTDFFASNGVIHTVSGIVP
jgi:Fasciclin domain